MPARRASPARRRARGSIRGAGRPRAPASPRVREGRARAPRQDRPRRASGSRRPPFPALFPRTSHRRSPRGRTRLPTHSGRPASRESPLCHRRTHRRRAPPCGRRPGTVVEFAPDLWKAAPVRLGLVRHRHEHVARLDGRLPLLDGTQPRAHARTDCRRSPARCTPRASRPRAPPPPPGRPAPHRAGQAARPRGPSSPSEARASSSEPPFASVATFCRLLRLEPRGYLRHLRLSRRPPPPSPDWPPGAPSPRSASARSASTASATSCFTSSHPPSPPSPPPAAAARPARRDRRPAGLRRADPRQLRGGALEVARSSSVRPSTSPTLVVEHHVPPVKRTLKPAVVLHELALLSAPPRRRRSPPCARRRAAVAAVGQPSRPHSAASTPYTSQARSPWRPPGRSACVRRKPRRPARACSVSSHRPSTSSSRRRPWSWPKRTAVARHGRRHVQQVERALDQVRLLRRRVAVRARPRRRDHLRRAAAPPEHERV